MKETFLVLMFGLLLLTPLRPALAFSTETNAAQNSDGLPKFADPDEQIPRFLVSPGNTNTDGRSLAPQDVTMPSVQNNDTGAHVFDRAFQHQQDR